MPSAMTGQPRITDSVIRRPRLERRLTEFAEQAPLILVSAGPGSGKTLAVAVWLQECELGRTAAWLTADRTHNRPGVLSRLVAAALEAEPSLLVLDDLQEITNIKVLHELIPSVDRLPARPRIVLISRSDPPLRLDRLRLGGLLRELRASDLAFNAVETALLFEQYGMRLTGAQVKALLGRTEGWAAGLRLAAMSLDPADVEAGIADFAGDQHSVAEYLVGEVLDRQPSRVREFLLRTSVVEELNASLAEALTSDPGAVAYLDRLAAQNALVSRQGHDRRWFRYHPLLRQMLVHQLMVEEPGRVAAQHRKAAQWHAAQGIVAEAAWHATQARDAELLGPVLLEAVLPRLPVLEAMENLAPLDPPAVPGVGEPGAMAAICSAAAHVQRGEYEAARGDVKSARRGVGALPPERVALAQLGLNALELLVCEGNGEARRAGELAGRSLRLLEEPAAVPPSAITGYRAGALYHLGVHEAWSGAATQAADRLGEAMRLAQRLHIDIAAPAIGHLALLAAADGALNTAEEHAATVLEGTTSAKGSAAVARLALAQVHLMRADFDAARAQIKAAQTLGADDPLVALGTRLAHAQLLPWLGSAGKAAAAIAEVRERMRPAGDAELLEHWATAAETGLHRMAGDHSAVVRVLTERAQRLPLTPSELVCLARAHIDQHRFGAAETVLHGVLAQQHDPRSMVEALLAQALIADHRHRDAEAVRAVHRALSLAEGEQVRLPFLSAGARIARIVRRHGEIDGAWRKFSDDLVTRILDAGAGPQPGEARAADLAEPLTERELIVLRYLPTMRRNSEIGAEIFVSVNTVKAHLKAIYRKLGVSDRREAVERARRLGLL